MLELWIRGVIKHHEEDLCLNEAVVKENVSVKKHGIKAAVFWNLITFGKCYTYRVYDSKEQRIILHESYVIRRCYKFPFLTGGSIEIGPCATNKKWRGRGIYPSVLKAIVQTELSGNDMAFMIIDSENKASIKGVTKAGFKRVSEVTKSKYLKIYTPLSRNKLY